MHRQLVDISVKNTFKCCAERNLISHLYFIPTKKGIHKNKQTRFVTSECRVIKIWRYKSDGTLGCSKPCIKYKRSIEKLGSDIIYTDYYEIIKKCHINNIQ